MATINFNQSTERSTELLNPETLTTNADISNEQSSQIGGTLQLPRGGGYRQALITDALGLERGALTRKSAEEWRGSAKKAVFAATSNAIVEDFVEQSQQQVSDQLSEQQIDNEKATLEKEDLLLERSVKETLQEKTVNHLRTRV